ncbi:L-2-hydroxyglutarate oxidase LhgO [Solibacillus isronensis B3W22]|uniref:L-2-hydroxyglutarate oxidase LhgO n=1 Tax=Solibacillus isronensis B3W22 TaxID=1224748 RepID=K1L399_9BACL|nr:L-2-hydroxyglutarate oxidase [Solibacillus isronensis]AMO86537.1 hydroxyglutarate oxidase [Solibacillus silvestris]EKB45118.1 L-2-hydroxyglutarate oxidase LhgO [Solibacillus isronensis B3W22]
MLEVVIIGGGIVGLSVGLALTERFPDKKVVILEKENSVSKHQTGNNSGVIHSGIYYKPGSFKARFAKQGSQSMVAFCKEHGIEYDICGKVIVATEQHELPLLQNLYERGIQNELEIEMLNAEQLKEIEPHVAGLGAIRVPQAGIVNYQQVSEKIRELIEKNGGEIRCGVEVKSINEHDNGVTIETSKGTVEAKVMINCAGLQSDRIAKMTGYSADLKIVPFRGEYYKLKESSRSLVNHLIYPVPNPDFPFLGVHYTRMIGGEVEAGPNAVLSFKREGYKKTDINLFDIAETLTYKGFWKLAGKNMKEGLNEMARSYSKGLFVKSLQKLIPEIQADDLEPGGAGVRAQALKSDGSMVDDFYFIPGKRSIHVLNAPSPAATASLEIGKEIVARFEKKFETV